MRRRLLACVLALSSLLPVSGQAKPVDFAFVQSVGGIKIKNPRREEEGWFLPVEIDVSGLKTVTVTPTAQNSGLACEKTSARVSGQKILITVHTGTPKPNRAATCPPAPLGNLESGAYDVYYDTGASGSSFVKASGVTAAPIGQIYISATSNILY